MMIRQILILFSFVAHLGLMIFIFFKSRRTTTNLLFCLFLFVLTVWIAAVFAMSLKWWAPHSWNITFAFGGMAGPVFILFFLSFIKLPLKPWYGLLGLPALVNFTGSLAGLVVLGFGQPIELQAEYGPLFPLWAITTLGYVLGVIYIVFKTYFSSDDPFKRAQLMFPMLAVLFTSLLGLVGYLVTPLLKGVRGGGFGLLHISLLSIPLSFTYSIIRYRYMDLTVALRGIFVFLIKVILLASLITLALFLLGLFPSHESFINFFLIALLVASSFFFLGRGLESMVDRAVFKTNYNYRLDIRRFGAELASLPLMGLSEISEFLSAQLKGLMGIKSVELFLMEGGNCKRTTPRETASLQCFETSLTLRKQLSDFLEHYEAVVKEELKHAEPEKYKLISVAFEELGSTLFIPLRLRGSLIGFMSLGEKASGDIYTSEDIHFLITIGGQTAVALDNARLYHDAMKRNRELSEKEMALRESEERFRLTFENAQDAIFWADADTGRLIHCNRRAEELLEMPREAIIGIHQTQLHPQDKREFYSQIFQNHIAAKGAIDIEAEIITKSGKIVPVNISSSIVHIGEMRVNQGIFRDVTERKRAEEALRESEERYRLLAENATDVIWTTDTHLNITYVSPSVSRVRGYTVEEVMNLTLGEQMTPPSLAYAVEVLAQELAIENQEKKDLSRSRTLELEFICKDGSTIWNEVKTSFIRDSVGRAIGTLGVGRDITDRKKAEKEKADLEQQLLQAQKMEAVGRLAGGIAHDFNNLLTVIKGYCDLSLMGLQEEGPLKRAIEEIHKAGDRASILTHQLLAFSRRQILELKIVNLNDILGNLNKMLRRLIGEDIELVTKLEEDLGNVRVDPGQMEQVVMNMAVNARDAMPMGGRIILETSNVEVNEVHARRQMGLKTGSYVMLVIKDTGVGIPPEVKEHIFEPFFTTKEKGKGTGLGLSMVYGIINQSGGSIGVESVSGQGTTFKIYIPRVKERDEALEVSPTRQEMPRGIETVLLVEDERAVRNLASQILKRQGYCVLEASSGEEALELYRVHQDPIHLVLTDVVMPRMSGRELTDRLLSFHPKIKILYMSGYTDDAILQHGVLEKGVNYIQKPFTMESLTRKVREVLDQEVS
jgi:PAS domain S-box-containing protein